MFHSGVIGFLRIGLGMHFSHHTVNTHFRVCVSVARLLAYFKAPDYIPSRLNRNPSTEELKTDRRIRSSKFPWLHRSAWNMGDSFKKEKK